MLIKKLLLLAIVILFCVDLISQDTLVVYLNSLHQKTTKEDATFIRKASQNDTTIFLTEKKIKGPRVFYCEFQTSDPKTEDGKAIYYNDRDSVYSKGSYSKGQMTGKWLYYVEGRAADTVDYSFLNNCDFKKDWHSIEYYKNDIFLRNTGNRAQESLELFLRSNFHLPGRVKINEITCISLWIDCIIDVDGRIKFASLKNSTDPDVDKEIGRILNLFHCELKINKPILLLAVPFYYEEPSVKKKGKENVFVVVDDMPTFKGGDAGLLKFISDNLNYPEIAKINNIKGKVIVKFRVRYDGIVDNIIVAKGADPFLDEEAVRVISLLPPFKPGKMKGKPVNVWYSLPIEFSLD